MTVKLSRKNKITGTACNGNLYRNEKVTVLPNRHIQSTGIQYSRNTRQQFKNMNMNKPNIIEQLAEIYPQLYLDPDRADTEEYRACVTRGEMPSSCSLSHFVMDERDSLENVDTPAGSAMVITLHSRHDFEVFVRCMTAPRQDPHTKVPSTTGAMTFTVFSWPRINAHKEAYFKEQQAAGVSLPDWNEEFRRFTSVKENCQDMLIVLSYGPYSGVSAGRVNELLPDRGSQPLSEEEWTEASWNIRKYHELTHFVCRKLYPDRIDAIWDELTADAVGLFAALGEYSRDLEELFLGINDCRYTGGRLENYTAEGADLDHLAAAADTVLRRFETAIGSAQSTDIFDIMIMLEELHDSCAHILQNNNGVHA